MNSHLQKVELMDETEDAPKHEDDIRKLQDDVLKDREDSLNGHEDLLSDHEDILNGLDDVQTYVKQIAWPQYRIKHKHGATQMRLCKRNEDLVNASSNACTSVVFRRAKVWNVRWFNADENTYYNMPFTYVKRGSSRNPPLFIGMHGGGNCPEYANQRQFVNHKHLYSNIVDGIYLVPRAPTNSWNMWFRREVRPLFDAIICNMIVNENVDSNRVYLFGYSAGGDGAFQMVPLMADRLAAGAAMAGHPNDANFTNLCNTPFANYCGQSDNAYHRNTANVKVGERLCAMQRDHRNEGLYENVLSVQYPTGHWMDKRDEAAIDWMASSIRNPKPKRIRWRLTHGEGATETRFFWLLFRCACGMSNNRPPTLVEGHADRQTIHVYFSGHSYRAGDSIVLLLSDGMGWDHTKPLTVCLVNRDDASTQELEVAERKLRKSVVRKSLDLWGDPNMVYATEVEVDLKHLFELSVQTTNSNVGNSES
ncbi:hypothetical protein SARC_02422 [Sphaeroforma arctica JP610]|uniref:Uncharacterized protein n=1 Tax=Sphaeroforma arctica JP610 TaxID=667725 RepID=A0A0L0GAU3_9EUKA|nr:hypothetical protein SARC_02422 [Sphaeroforma arctica JP610]KNC85388.1 hypothetical protein SARC_02422 [Sphaeroforma arctica JP610]|eukprot:XP_014159290.1 hypothetical protein SARC_02422 [Sphaeroforma arctica JP610]